MQRLPDRLYGCIAPSATKRDGTLAPFPTEEQWVSRDVSLPILGGARGGWGAIWVHGLLLPQGKGHVVGLGSGYGLGARPWGVRARVVI